MKLVRIASLVMLAIGLGGATSWALAQEADFPKRPLRIVVPYPPGGAPDAISRAVAEEAAKRLGQSIVVENKPGGGTLVGTLTAKTSPADGYTLMFQTASFLNNTYLIKKPGYELSDFAPLATIADAAFVMLVSTKVPAKTLPEFIAYAKANPGKVNYGSVGRGTLANRLSLKARFDWTEINFKGIAEAAQSVMANDVQAFFSTQGYASSQVGSRELRLMAVTGDKRVAFFPEVPTFAELGYPEMSDKVWYALFIRRETPKPIFDKLHAVMLETMNSPVIKEALSRNGLVPFEGNLQLFQARMQAELSSFVEEAKQLGIEPQ